MKSCISLGLLLTLSACTEPNGSYPKLGPDPTGTPPGPSTEQPPRTDPVEPVMPLVDELILSLQGRVASLSMGFKEAARERTLLHLTGTLENNAASLTDAALPRYRAALVCNDSNCATYTLALTRDGTSLGSADVVRHMFSGTPTFTPKASSDPSSLDSVSAQAAKILSQARIPLQTVGEVIEMKSLKNLYKLDIMNTPVYRVLSVWGALGTSQTTYMHVGSDEASYRASTVFVSTASLLTLTVSFLEADSGKELSLYSIGSTGAGGTVVTGN